MDMSAFKDHLIWAEDWRNFPYQDSVGKTSIGVGRNLDDNGLSDDEVNYLLQNDMRRAVIDASSFPYWDSLSDARQLVVADMCFNLGLARFRGFVRTNQALEGGDWSLAAEEMVDSKWYRQVGRRARRLVEIMRKGTLE